MSVNINVIAENNNFLNIILDKQWENVLEVFSDSLVYEVLQHITYFSNI